MTRIHIVPTLDAIYDHQSPFKNIYMNIMNDDTKVGEAQVVLMDYCQILADGDSLDTAARYVSEDMNLALQALHKSSLFKGKTLHPNYQMYCRVPIIAYLARLYIYPEYRKSGYGSAFLDMLPGAIAHITMSAPIAIAVYISPQTKIQHCSGAIADMLLSDITTMYHTMEQMFLNAGYTKPSRRAAHKCCMCWIERKGK